MDRGDSPQDSLIGLLQRRFAGKRLSLVRLDVTASLRVSLLNEMTFHQAKFIMPFHPLQARIYL